MNKSILTINAGSSSLKFALFSITPEETTPVKKLLSGQISQILSPEPQFSMLDLKRDVRHKKTLKIKKGADPYKISSEFIFSAILALYPSIEIEAVANRVVHGGDQFKKTTQINDQVLEQLAEFIPLAALHQPYNLGIARYFYDANPKAKHFACLDTAFHQSIDEIERTYAIPMEWTRRGIKKYGFHGLSYQYIVHKLAYHVGENAADKRWVLCHLGSGASVAAIHHKKSVATTMGFSVIAGIPMATRCGDIDPEISIYLQQHEKMTVEQVQDMLYHKSGLFGASGGISDDMHLLESSPKPEARFAIDLFCHKVVLSIGQLIAAAGGLDGLVFTAGIGENSSYVRKTICNKLAWLGIEISDERNQRNEPEIHITSSLPVLVIPTDEEYIMAAEAYKMI